MVEGVLVGQQLVLAPAYGPSQQLNPPVPDRQVAEEEVPTHLVVNVRLLPLRLQPRPLLPSCVLLLRPLREKLKGLKKPPYFRLIRSGLHLVDLAVEVAPSNDVQRGKPFPQREEMPDEFEDIQPFPLLLLGAGQMQADEEEVVKEAD